MITSTIHVLLLVPVFFVLMKERELRRGTLQRENHIRSHSKPADRDRWMSPRIAWYASSMRELTIARQTIALCGRRLEYFTIGWNSLEGLIAVGAGVVAGSISLVGFGVDSFIEVTSGVTLLWRMSVDADVESENETKN